MSFTITGGANFTAGCASFFLGAFAPRLATGAVNFSMVTVGGGGGTGGAGGGGGGKCFLLGLGGGGGGTGATAGLGGFACCVDCADSEAAAIIQAIER